jgi:hypothetical protein
VWVTVINECSDGPQRRQRLRAAQETGPFVPAQHIADFGVDQVRRVPAHAGQSGAQLVGGWSLAT